MQIQELAQDEYFASIEDPNRLASAMQGKIRAWRDWANGNGLVPLWQKKLRNYYGMASGGNSSMAITPGGAEGELDMMKVNDLHSLIQNQLIIITGQRPAGIAKAINSDTKSLKSSKIGTAVAEYYMDQIGFEASFIQATEIALLCDEGYVELFWDKTIGDPVAVDPETGLPEMSGDLILRSHSPWNVTRDPGLNVSEQKWYIVTLKLNKFEMAEAYPKFRDQILEAKDDLPQVPMNDLPDNTDAVFGHLLIHDRTKACPNGRYALMIGDSVVFDMELPYKDFPVDRISPANVIDGPTGYCAANDMMALEEATDALHSIIITNQLHFGGNTIIGPTGSNINGTDLAKGSRYIEVQPDYVDKIRSLALTHTAPEIFNYLNALGQKKEQSVGSNSVVRGQPEGELAGASGAALALIQAQSISFNSGTQKAYFQMLSSTMTKAIGILAKFSPFDRIAPIVGKVKMVGFREFQYNGYDLHQVSAIVYELTNPMAQTLGGRLTFAQDLLKAQMIKSPKQYLTVATTGQIDTLTEDDEADQMLILEENEWLNEGKPFEPIITQNHLDHIKSHTSQITLDAQAGNPQMVQNTLAHIQKHIDLWSQMSASNPGLLMAIGLPQLPIPPTPGALPPGPPQGPTPMPPHHGPKPPPKQTPHSMTGISNPVEQKASETQLPNFPDIAGTKQQAIIPGVTNA